jgi:hypothetical protein
MSAFGIMEDVAAQVMRERRNAVSRHRHPAAPGQSEIRVRWKLRADREGVGPRWPW